MCASAKVQDQAAHWIDTAEQSWCSLLTRWEVSSNRLSDSSPPGAYIRRDAIRFQLCFCKQGMCLIYSSTEVINTCSSYRPSAHKAGYTVTMHLLGM